MNAEDKQPSWRRPALTDSEWNAKLVLDKVFQHGNYIVFPGFKLSTIIHEPPKGFSRQSPEWNKELYFFETYRVRSYQFYCGIPSGELAEDLAVAAIGERLKRMHPTMLLHSRVTLERKFKSLQEQR